MTNPIHIWHNIRRACFRIYEETNYDRALNYIKNLKVLQNFKHGLKGELLFYNKFYDKMQLEPLLDAGVKADFVGFQNKQMINFDVTTNLKYKDIDKYKEIILIRIYSSLDIKECISLINVLIEEPLPHIEKFDDEILVLHELSASNEILTILLFSESNNKDVTLLKSSIKHHSKSNLSTSVKDLFIGKMVFAT